MRAITASIIVCFLSFTAIAQDSADKSGKIESAEEARTLYAIACAQMITSVVDKIRAEDVAKQTNDATSATLLDDQIRRLNGVADAFGCSMVFRVDNK